MPLNFDPGADVANINVPVLVLHGTDDVVTPREAVQEVADGLPNGRLQMIEGVNHFPQTEKPDIVNGIIEQFLREIDLA